MTAAFQSFGEQPSHSTVDCSMPLCELFVWRTSSAPTVRTSHERSGAVKYFVTPYRVVQQLGITTYLNYQLAEARAIAEVANGTSMDAHYSVVSYLWALRFYGIDPVILEWPTDSGTRLITKKVDGDKVWNGTAYRPTYALAALIKIGLTNAEFDQLAAEFRRVPERQRVATLRRTAAFYLQNPVDSFDQKNGYHALVGRHGLHPVL